MIAEVDGEGRKRREEKKLKVEGGQVGGKQAPLSGELALCQSAS